MSLHLLEFFDFVIPSLFDYHAAVQTSSFSTLVSASYNLTIIFGHCQRTTYFRIMLLFLLQVEYLLDQAHPAYYALLQAPNLLNEEICEILLADLARRLTSNPKKNECSTMAWEFVQRHKTRSIATSEDIHKLRNYRLIDTERDGDRIEKTVEWLEGLMQKMLTIENNTHQPATPEDCGIPPLPKRGLIQLQSWIAILTKKLHDMKKLYIDDQASAMWIYDNFKDALDVGNQLLTRDIDEDDGESDDEELDDLPGNEIDPLLGDYEDAEEFLVNG